MIWRPTTWRGRPSPSRRVLLVTPGDIYLSGAFGILPRVHVDEITPDAYAPARARCVDAAIFEQTLPATLPPAPVPIFAVYPPSTPATATTPTTNTTAIPVGASLGLTVGSATSANGLQAGDDPYRLLQDVALNGVAVGSVRPLVTPPWGYAVLRTNGLPVLVAGQNGARREAVLGFEPSDSTWGGSVGFPIAMQNLLDWLAPATTSTNGIYRPGDPVALPTPACAANATVTDPTGAKISASALSLTGASTASGAASTDTTGVAAPLFTDTGAPGLYSVEQTTPGGVQRAIFAVNLFPLPQASNAAASTGGGNSAPVASAKLARVPVEWAPLAAALALLALCYEWFVAARRR
jgi:Ca-activated chloride channel family protein